MLENAAKHAEVCIAQADAGTRLRKGDSKQETQGRSTRARELGQLASEHETEGSWFTSGMPDEYRILPLSHLEFRPLQTATDVQLPKPGYTKAILCTSQ